MLVNSLKDRRLSYKMCAKLFNFIPTYSLHSTQLKFLSYILGYNIFYKTIYSYFNVFFREVNHYSKKCTVIAIFDNTIHFIANIAIVLLSYC